MLFCKITIIIHVDVGKLQHLPEVFQKNYVEGKKKSYYGTRKKRSRGKTRKVEKAKIKQADVAERKEGRRITLLGKSLSLSLPLSRVASGARTKTQKRGEHTSCGIL